jgi:serine phosphatase RsbU (regulator of sigma subunit)
VGGFAASFAAGAYSPRLLGLPYALTAIALLALVVALVVMRGSPLYRWPLLTIGLVALVWSSCSALAACTRDPDVATPLYHVAIAPVSLVGPSLLILILGLGGGVSARRWLVAASVLAALASSVITLLTPLVISRVWETSVGLLFFRAGPLLLLHVSNLWVWPLVAALLVRGGSGVRVQRHLGRMILVVALVIVSTSDSLLAYGIGVYPFSWLSAGAAGLVALHGITRRDLMKSEGFDRATTRGAMVVLAMAIALAIVVRAGVVGTGLFAAVPLYCAAELGILGFGRRRVGASALHAREAARRFRASVSEVRSEVELHASLATLLGEELGLTDVRLYTGEVLLVPAGDGTPVTVDARVRAWLRANHGPLLLDRLTAARLGGLRAPVEAFVRALGAQVVLPLFDRQVLVGAIVTGAREGDRALGDADLRLLVDVQGMAVRALTYARLYREEAAQVEAQRELEAAAASQLSGVGESVVRLGLCEITTHYTTARALGGGFAQSWEIKDGRVLVAIGDMVGGGLPGALVGATVAGAADTAVRMQGAGIDLISTLELLHTSVRAIGHGRYAMSCFLALFDPGERAVTFANAGSRFPYVVRAARGRKGDELGALVARGTPIGGDARPIFAAARVELRREDVVVLYSGALVESRGRAGDPWGERRFQRLLRNVRSRGPGMCKAIVDTAAAHRDGVAPVDDVVVVVVRSS